MGDATADPNSHTRSGGIARRTLAVVNLQRFREPLLDVGSALIVCLGLLQCFLIFNSMHGRATQTDFSTYYLTAKAVAGHRNPYTDDFVPAIERLGYDTGGVTHATDPPTFVMMIAPLSRLSIDRAFWLWSLISAICLAVSAYLLFGPGSGLPIRTELILISLVMCYPPVAANLFFGQSKLQTLMLLTLMLALMKAHRDGAAGIALALAILLRIFPLAMIGYVVLLRRWRLLIFATAGCAIGALFTLLVLGSADTLSFTRGIATLTDQHWASLPQDLSTSGFISRVFLAISPTSESGLTHFVRRGAVVCARLVFVLLTVRATLAFAPTQDRDWRLFSLWVIASVLLSPISWLHYEVIFLILFGQLAVAASHGRASRRSIAMAVTNCLLALVWAGGGDVYAIHPRAWWQQIIGEFGFFSMLAAYISAYWFATDEADAVQLPFRAVPAEIWRRLTPAT